MITSLATSQNWKNNKEKKKPCRRAGVVGAVRGFCPSPSSTRTPSAARAFLAVEFPLYNRHGQTPIPIDALHSQPAPNKFSTFFLLSLELCSFFVPR
jgi:hypothetical protein